MLDFSYKIYEFINRNKSSFNNNIKFFLRISINIILPFYFKLTCKNKKYKLNNLTQTTLSKERYVVTLTSFPARINRVWLVIETMLRQKTKPDLIILWLSELQFASLNQIPSNLKNMTKRGLQIRIMPGDLRSHKKYAYALKEYPNDNIITIDDDIFYSDNALTELINSHKKYPQYVVCRYAHQILRIDKQILPYVKWGKVEANKTSKEIFFGSGGGTLFPPQSLHKDTTEEELFRKLSFHADDIWLNAMCRLNKTPIISIHSNCVLLPVLNLKREKLCDINVGEGLNDKQLQDVRDYYLQTIHIDPFEGEV